MSLFNFCNVPGYVSEIYSHAMSGKLPCGLIYIDNLILVINRADRHFYDSVEYDTMCLNHYIDELFQLQDIKIVDKIGPIIGYNEQKLEALVEKIKHEIYGLYYKDFHSFDGSKIFAMHLTFYVKKNRTLNYIVKFCSGNDLLTSKAYNTLKHS